MTKNSYWSLLDSQALMYKKPMSGTKYLITEFHQSQRKIEEIVDQQAKSMGIDDTEIIRKAKDQLINDTQIYEKTVPTLYRMAEKALMPVKIF